jgi:hypothetical protein
VRLVTSTGDDGVRWERSATKVYVIIPLAEETTRR